MAGRIRIEPYKPLDIHTPAVPGGGYIKIDASAASPGTFGPSPLAKLGLQIAQGLPSVAQSVSDQLARDDEAVVKDADTRLGETEQKLLFDAQTGYLNTQGQQAVNQAEAVLNAYSEAQQRTVADLPDDAQRRMLEDLAQRRLATFTDQIERHSATERQRWYDTASDQRIALMQADAGLNWSDDTILRRALGTVRAEVRDKADHHHWPSALTETTLRKQTSRTLASAIEAAVERDPERARSLRTRYDEYFDAPDQIALDALLVEAEVRKRADAASGEILNSAPSDGETPTLQWQLKQADSIAEHEVRARAARHLHSAAAATEARARALGEQVLARVLKDGLTDSAEVPLREWVALDASRRQAIETRIDHNARGEEPATIPALVDKLATEMTQAPQAFARRDLVPVIAQLPLPQWQRFRDWQAGIRRGDPTTIDELYAIARGLQMTQKLSPGPSLANDNSAPPSSAPDALLRAALVEEIGVVRKLTGKSPDDTALRTMVQRNLPVGSVHNVGLPMPSNDELVRRLLGPRGLGINAPPYLFLWALLDHLAQQSRRMYGAAPQSSQAPISPSKEPSDNDALTTLLLAAFINGLMLQWGIRPTTPPSDFRGAQSRTAPVQRRDALSPQQVKEWTTPPPFPLGEPQPPLPGLIPPSLPKMEEGFTVVPPPPPLPGFSYPEIDVPLYVEAEWEWHHHFPQRFWNPDRQNPYPFSRDARRFFDKQIVRVPRGDHWGKLHNTYNKVVGQMLEAYLVWKAAEAGKSVDALVRGMTAEEARECYRKVLDTIRASADDASQDLKDAKEFLTKMESFGTETGKVP